MMLRLSSMKDQWPSCTFKNIYLQSLHKYIDIVSINPFEFAKGLSFTFYKKKILVPQDFMRMTSLVYFKIRTRSIQYSIRFYMNMNILFSVKFLPSVDYYRILSNFENQ